MNNRNVAFIVMRNTTANTILDIGNVDGTQIQELIFCGIPAVARNEISLNTVAANVVITAVNKIPRDGGMIRTR